MTPDEENFEVNKGFRILMPDSRLVFGALPKRLVMFQNLIGSAVLVFGSLFTLAANSQESEIVRLMNSHVGTTSISALPQFSDGKLNACLLEFNSLARDDIYLPNRFSKVYGSFGLMAVQQSVAVTLKIVVLDFDLKDGSTKPNAPFGGYFVFGHQTSRDSLVGKYRSDTPGGLFSIFKLDPTFPLLADQINKDRVTIAFNRRSGGADIVVPLDLTVADTDGAGKKSRSAKMVADFYACGQQMMDGLDKK